MREEEREDGWCGICMDGIWKRKDLMAMGEVVGVWHLGYSCKGLASMVVLWNPRMSMCHLLFIFDMVFHSVNTSSHMLTASWNWLTKRLLFQMGQKYSTTPDSHIEHAHTGAWTSTRSRVRIARRFSSP
jgi:hypothetical protein